MVKIKMKDGTIKFVTPNIAHGYIDRGEATLVEHEEETKDEPRSKRSTYTDRQMVSETEAKSSKKKSSLSKKYKTK